MTSIAVTEVTQTVVVTDSTGTAIVQIDKVGPQGPAGSSVPRSVTIVDPAADETFTLFYTKVNTTLSSVRALVQGTSPGVTFVLKADPDRNAAGTAVISSTTVTSTTTGTEAVIINQPIPTGFYVWLEITAISGTVTEFNVGIEV